MVFEDLLPRLMEHQSQIALVVSGGGTGAIGSCFGRAGASAVFVEAVVPYSRNSMVDYLQEQPSGPSASIETAKQLADRAMQRAKAFADRKDGLLVGLAMTCALPTVPPRNQVHQIHVAIKSDPFTNGWSEDEKGQFATDFATRQQAECLASQMIVNTLAMFVAALS